jgi:peroxiredoxin
METTDRARREARVLTTAFAAATLASALIFPGRVQAAPSVGAAAPDFALKDLSGSNQRLSELRGEAVVLTFWASFCGPCRDALQSVDVAVADRAGEAVALGVNLDRDADRAASVAGSLGLRFPSLLDTAQSVSRLYDVQHLPLTLLIDREGTVRQVWSREPVAAEVLIRHIRELDP